MKKQKTEKPKNIKAMTRKELMEKIKQMETQTTSPIEAPVDLGIPEQTPEIQTETEASGDFIEGPSVPMRIHSEVLAGMQNPEIFNQPVPQVQPKALSQKARMLMSLPEIPCGVIPDKPQAKKVNTVPQVPRVNLPTEGLQGNAPCDVTPRQSIAIPVTPESYSAQTAKVAQPVTWSGKNVFIAMPCYKYVNAGTMWNMVQLAMDLGKDLAHFDMELGDAMIYHARNKLADRFMKSSAQWMFFLDDDMIIPTGRATWFRWIGNLPKPQWSDELCGRHALLRLLSHGKTLVGGTYFGRQVTGVPVSSAAWNPQETSLARQMMNMVRPANWVGTGCLLISRDVFLGIQQKFPELAPSGQRKWWDYFLPTDHGGEDVSFCTRAMQVGHQPWLDLGTQCLHVGWSCYGAHNTGMKPEVVVS